MREIRSGNLNFVILDRYSFVELLSSISIKPRWIWICQAICRVLMNLTHLFLGQICMQNAACGLFTWMTNGLFGFKKTITHHLSLLTQFSSLITPHSSLKIPQLPKPRTFGTLFSTSHHLKICTFCGTHCLSTMSSSRLPYPCVSSLSL